MPPAKHVKCAIVGVTRFCLYSPIYVKPLVDFLKKKIETRSVTKKIRNGSQIYRYKKRSSLNT